VLRSTLAIFAVLAAGCVKQLPPAAPPAHAVPALSLPALPPPGHGRLVVDVVEGPTSISRMTVAAEAVDRPGRPPVYRFTELAEAGCLTPCLIDLPVGNVLLGFPVLGKPAPEVELVHVGPDPSVYRRTLSVYEDATGGLRVFGFVAVPVGFVAAATGGTILAAGLQRDHDGLVTGGAITLGASTLLVALGLWALRTDAPTFRPGAASHYPL